MTKDQLHQITSGRFFWLLVAMVAAILFAGFSSSGPAGRWESALTLIGILVAATYAARGGRTRFLVTLLLNGLLLATGFRFLFRHSPEAEYLCFIVLLIALVFSLITTLSFVLAGGRIQPDHIYGAICAYVMIAMIFATIYTLEALVIPGAFNGVQPLDPSDRPWQDMLYFSFTTLSTVGYGDITPVHRAARAVCNIEMLTGTFYVAILIARLAGLYPPSAPKD